MTNIIKTLRELQGYRLSEICSEAADELIIAHARIAELESIVARLSKPDQWWDWDDSEYPIDDPDEWLDSAGMNVSGGEVYRFHASKRMPDEYYEVVASEGEDPFELVPTTKAAWEAHRLLQSRNPGPFGDNS